VRLVPLDRARHLDNAVRWLNDPETTSWLMLGDLPLSRLAEEEYFNKVALGDPNDVQFAVETCRGEHVGFCGIHRIEWRHRVAETGTVIGDKRRWRQGLGLDAMRVRTRYAREVLGLRQLYATVFAENEASRRALQRAGYSEVGRLPRRYWKRGRHRDVLLLLCELEQRVRSRA